MKIQMCITTGALALTAVACGSDGDVNLAVTVPQTSPLIGTATTSETLQLEAGTNTLVVNSAQVVVQEIEFERDEASGSCALSANDDACESFEVGPRLLNLPLSGAVALEVTQEIPEGEYDEIEIDIHRLTDSGEDQAIAAQVPELAGASILVTGTFDGAAFTFTTDIDQELELEFDPPLNVDGTSGVTLSFDLAAWFTDSSGNLVDPRTALAGGANESLVEGNIRQSIVSFEDDDQDGVSD